MTTTILLANEHQIVREALRALLEQRPDLRVVGQASNGQEAVDLAEQLRPDVVIMDLLMPRLSSWDATRRITQYGCRVLILGTRDGHQKLDEVLRAGAAGCLLKESEPEEIFSAIGAVRRGQVYLSPSVTQGVVDALTQSHAGDSPLAQLTAREREVLQLIAEGYSSKEIAAQLCVSVKTVDSHRAALMKKLGIHKASGLVLFAIRSGLVEP